MPEHPGTRDLISEPDEPLHWWERRAAEPGPGGDPGYDEDCDDR